MVKKQRLLLSLKLFGIICGLWIVQGNLFGQDEKFKALFIYNFTKYIEWPDISGSEFKITVLGDANLVTELVQIASKKAVGLNSIIVSSVKAGSEVKKCQILFISHKNMGELPKLIEKVKGSNMLIITEAPNGCSLGASMNFVTTNGSIKFEISKLNIDNAGLKVNEGLLKLGILVN